MLRIVKDALRARRTQAATVFVLTALAVAVAAAAPWYVSAAARAVAVADVSGAPSNQLVAVATGRITGPGPGGTISGDDLVDRVRSEGREALDLPGARSTAAIREGGTLTTGVARATVPIAYRDDLCDNVIIDGACPDGADELLLSRRTADLLQVAPGDAVSYVSTATRGRPMRVVGVYQLDEPLGRYWAGTPLGGAPGLESTTEGGGDPAFTTGDTLAALKLREYTVEFHVAMPDAMFTDDAAGLVDRLEREARTADTWRVSTRADFLANRIALERRLLDLGVAVAASQLLLLAWLGLFFAVRHTAEQRRPDLGLLKLHGSSDWRMWTLASGQSVVPILAGAVLGAAVGLGAARLAAGDVGPDGPRAATLSAVAAGLALLGALVAAVAADVRGMRAGVIDLLRHVPARRRGWRADVIDLVLVLVAAAGLYQARAAASGPGGVGGVALLAPALVALVVALVAARVLTPLAGRIGARALRDGRLPLALGATQLARRPGTHRVFALLVVAVALLTTAVGGWAASSGARAERSVHEAGADRVLTVQARSRAHLLAAVRAADPSGRVAMAVVRGQVGPAEAVLAVDSARLAAVTSWPDSYGTPGPAGIAALLRPESATPVRVPDGELTLTAAAAGGENDPVYVQARLQTPAGDERMLRFGPVGATAGRSTADAADCGADGCRLVGFSLLGLDPNGVPVRPSDGRQVTITALDGPGGPILAGAQLADVTRWRTGVGSRTAGPRIAAETGGLTVTVNDPAVAGLTRSTEVFAVDAPTPLPVVRTGEPPRIASGDRRLGLFGGEGVPVRWEAATRTMPSVPEVGYLVDLEYADRVAEGSGLGDVPQVWLAAGAPAALLDRLTGAGLTIVDDQSVAGVADRLDREGPPAALRFQVAAGLIGLLLAAGAFVVVAAVERPERAVELAALRVQGLPPAVARSVAYGGYAGLALAAVVLGVVASVLAQAVTRRPIPLFVDGWRVLPVDVGPQPLPALVALVAGVLVAGVVGVAAATRLLRAVRGGGA